MLIQPEIKLDIEKLEQQQHKILGYWIHSVDLIHKYPGVVIALCFRE